MKANELRIGNWVRLKARDFVFEMEKDWLTPSAMTEIEPIPLTPEWLEKFGFEFFHGWWYIDAYSPGHPSQRFDLYWSPVDGFMTKSRYQPDIQDQFFMRHIKHIHEVQNLYFALTGEELTIVSPAQIQPPKTEAQEP